MESSKSRQNIPKSDAIWISKSTSSSSSSKFLDPGRGSFDSGLSTSGSSSSLGAMSGTSVSPPFYKRSISNGYGPGGVLLPEEENRLAGRRRTMTVPNADEAGDIFSTSPFSSSGSKASQFRRSNSISTGGSNGDFGGIIKRSIGTLFNAATVNTSLATATIQKSVPKVKCVPNQLGRRNSGDRNDPHFTDHMVSYLCESAIR